MDLSLKIYLKDSFFFTSLPQNATGNCEEIFNSENLLIF